MPKYKIIKIYIVDAPTRIAARHTFTDAQAQGSEEEYLEHISIKEAGSNGWVNSLKQQLTGSKS